MKTLKLDALSDLTESHRARLDFSRFVFTQLLVKDSCDARLTYDYGKTKEYLLSDTMLTLGE